MIPLTHKQGEGARITLSDRTIEIIVTSFNRRTKEDVDLEIRGLEDRSLTTLHLTVEQGFHELFPPAVNLALVHPEKCIGQQVRLIYDVDSQYDLKRISPKRKN